MSSVGPDYDDMIENAPCGHMTLHANSRVEHVNRTFLAWTGHALAARTARRQIQCYIR